MDQTEVLDKMFATFSYSCNYMLIIHIHFHDAEVDSFAACARQWGMWTPWWRAITESLPMHGYAGRQGQLLSRIEKEVLIPLETIASIDSVHHSEWWTVWWLDWLSEDAIGLAFHVRSSAGITALSTCSTWLLERACCMCPWGLSRSLHIADCQFQVWVLVFLNTRNSNNMGLSVSCGGLMAYAY